MKREREEEEKERRNGKEKMTIEQDKIILKKE